MEDDLTFYNSLLSDNHFAGDQCKADTLDCFSTQTSNTIETTNFEPKEQKLPFFVRPISPVKIRKRRTNPNARIRTKKNEELDKFWLRSFRDHIKKNFYSRKFNIEEKQFWEDYFSKEKTPGKERSFAPMEKATNYGSLHTKFFPLNFRSGF